MESRAIEFEALIEICKYRSNCGRKCSEDDNFTGHCEENDCPIWGEMEISIEDED